MRGTLNERDRPVAPSAEQHSERYAMTRPIPYETIPAVQEDDAFESQSVMEQRGKALSINISSGGMLILMDRAPTIGQVLKVLVPTPVHPARTPIRRRPHCANVSFRSTSNPGCSSPTHVLKCCSVCWGRCIRDRARADSATSTRAAP